MKVSELVKKLTQLDQNLEVYCYEDGPVPLQQGMPGPFDLVDVSSAAVEISRDATGKPKMKFESSSSSVKVAIIGITPDF